MSKPPASSLRPLDPAALAQVMRRLHRATEPPWLHEEAARRMAERLPIVRLQPRRVLAWGLHLGGGAAVLQQAYPQAEVVAVESEPAVRVQAPRRWWSVRRAEPATLAPDAVPANSAQLVWSNMGLHGSVDPQAVMRQWYAALAVDGFLMFSTLGPGTLQPLRDVYSAQGWLQPHAPFVDMHDLGDMLLEAGFADPVMDQETLTLTWPSAEAALAELRGLGGNVARDRHAGLRSPRWRQQLLHAMRTQLVAGQAGRISLPFEIVYGHAFRPLPRPRLGPQTEVSLDDMRTLVRGSTRRT